MEPVWRELADPTRPVYHRKIRLAASPGEVRGDIADNPHHFRIVLRHDGERVTGIRGEALRHPWTSCPEAVEELRSLIGMPLSERSTAVGSRADARLQCTHLFDLAGLAVAQAARGTPRRDYHCTVQREPSGADLARCLRDGEPVLEWRVDGGQIREPTPFAGTALYGNFLRWAERTLDPDTAEAAIVLRRACFVSPVRFIDDSGWERASDLGNGPVCFTFQPGRPERALRVRGSFRDFSADPKRLLPAEGD